MNSFKTISNGKYESFFTSNPDFNLLKHDFIDPRLRSEVDWTGYDEEEARPELMTYQRLLRLHKQTEVVEKLKSHGLLSAHHITQSTEDSFVNAYLDKLGLPEDELRQMHRRAMRIKQRVQMLAVELKGTAGSPYYRNSKMNNVTTQPKSRADSSKLAGSEMENPPDNPTIDYIKSIPSYQSFFGSLDYYECPHDQSVLSPAAYLTDLLRIVYQCIDNASTHPDIPDNWHLNERRPDIEKIPLTAEMTNNLVPYIQIMNSVLEQFIAKETKWVDIYQGFWGEVYPFNQPFVLPLTQIRIYLKKLSTSLVEVYQTYQKSPEPSSPPLPDTTQIALESLNLNPPRLKIISTWLGADKKEIGAQYGFSSDVKYLSYTGSGTVKINKNDDVVFGTDTLFHTEIHVGDQIQIGNQRRVVDDIKKDTSLHVNSNWTESVKDSTYTIFPKDYLNSTENFIKRTGLDFEQLNELIYQGLSPQELAAGVNRNFFINRVGSSPNNPLELLIDRSAPGFPVSTINALHYNTLGQLGNFIKLARSSEIKFADLDWVLKNICKSDGAMNTKNLRLIGQVKLAAAKMGTSLLETVGLFNILKTIGVTDPAHPADLFDRLFNTAAIFGIPEGVVPAFTAKGTVTIQKSKLLSVTGNGTDFKDQLKKGMRIRINGEVRLVESIKNNTNLTVNKPFTAAAQDTVMVVYPSAELPMDSLPVYHPSYEHNSLYTDPVANWTVDETADVEQQNIRNRLKGGLEIGDDELTLIGQQAMDVLGISRDSSIPLTVENLSLLYSYAKMAQLTGLTVEHYLKFLNTLDLKSLQVLVDYDHGGDVQTLYAAVENVNKVYDYALWLKKSKLDPYALEYILKGSNNKKYSSKIILKDLPDFLTSLWTAAPEWLLNENSFINQYIDAAKSADCFKILVDRGFLNDEGVVLNTYLGDEGKSEFDRQGFNKASHVEPFSPNSFETDQINADQSSACYHSLLNGNVLFATSDPKISCLKYNYSSETIDNLFPDVTDDYLRHIMIEQVRVRIISAWNIINSVTQTLITAGVMPSIENPNQGTQYFNLCLQLGVFFDSDTDIILVLASVIADYLGIDCLPELFFQPPPSNDELMSPDNSVNQFMTWLSRLTILVDTLALSAADLKIITANPASFHYETLDNLTLDTILSIGQYKWLASGYNDTDNRLGLYFSYQPDREEDKLQILSTLTGWDPGQIKQLKETLWSDNSDIYNSVRGLVRMKKCFDLANELNIDITGSLQLAQLASLMDADADEAVDTAWPKYNRAVALTMSSVKSRFGGNSGDNGEQWTKEYRPVQNAVNEKKRDVLADYALFKLKARYPVMDSHEALYNYFLIDTEMSGVSDISYIKQAILSVQLYMERARMMLEPGITNPSIPDTWWSWLSSYRTWEANRKVFLYPENYLEPELRHDSTELFNKACEGLTANNITAKTVNNAYVEYFETFESLAGLKQVSAFYGTAPDPSPNSEGTLFIIARTTTEPYIYYYQSKMDNKPWTAWKKIDQTIPAAIATPVYAFNRLFLFWVEQTNTSASEITEGTATNSLDTKATIKYIFINYSGKWCSPQTLDTMVINYKPLPPSCYNTFNPKVIYKVTLISGLLHAININDIRWHIISPIVLNGANETKQYILINYGDFLNILYYALYDKIKDYTNQINPDALQLINQYIDEIDFCRTYGKNSETNNLNAYLYQGRMLDSNLNVSSTNTVCLNDYINDISKPDKVTDLKTYFPYISHSDQSKLIIKCLKKGDRNIFLIHYLGSGSSSPVDEISIEDDVYPLMFNISDRYGYTSPVVNMPFWFIFDNGDETFLLRARENNPMTMNEIVQTTSNLSGQTNEIDLMAKQYANPGLRPKDTKWSVERLSTGAVPRLNQALFSGGVSKLLDVNTQITPDTSLYPFDRFYETPPDPPANLYCNPDYNSQSPQPLRLMAGDAIDYDGPYGLYFWEIYFFIPWLIANQLKNNQHYETAKKWLEYIFNPTIAKDTDKTIGHDGNQQDRFWRFLKLRDLSIESMQSILTNTDQINAYNDHPFEPNEIAKLRSSTYQKAIVMRYVDILLEWGDYEFTIDTWESITEATMLYMLAHELLGPKPVAVGPCPVQESKTFTDIKTQYHEDRSGMTQFFIAMENTVPPAHDSPTDLPPNPYVPFNDLDIYFCVPENKNLASCWDKVEDRLYKIRHGMNIQGVVRTLNLFEAPLDLSSIIRNHAADATMQAVDQFFSIAPVYRFKAVISLAKNYTSELTQIGNLLLSALEKKDAEEISRLRASQEQRILKLTTKIRNLQVQEIEENLIGLEISRNAAQTRRGYYQDLINKGLIPEEELHIAMTVLSNVLSTAGSIMRTLGAISYTVPNVGSPFAMTYGGREIGHSLSTASSVFDIAAGIAGTVGSVSLTSAGYVRRAQEWEQQLNQAESDVNQINSQIKALKIQLQNSQQQLDINQVEIENSTEIENFLKTKFTTQELYQWMAGRISAVFQEAYRLALEVAMAAEQAYQFELCSNEQFIHYQYWDSACKGLLSGEQLMLSLSQMESSYYQNNVRKLEIEKTISLLALDPVALSNLKSTGSCTFNLSEFLFDCDYPGHYARQIKSMSITIPAVIGPYQNFKATLTQLGSQILIKPDIDCVSCLLGLNDTAPDTSILRSNWRANQKIALSKGVDDSGLFAFNFDDERYLPFEGTGAISNWQLDIPKSSNRLDYDSLSDVIINLKYTASDGGEKFREDVSGLIADVPCQCSLACDLAKTCPDAWHAFMNPDKTATAQSLAIVITPDVLPANLPSDLPLKSIYFQLTLKDGSPLGDNLTVSLNIGTESNKYELTFDDDNMFIELNDPSLSSAPWIGQPWTITVEQTDIPGGIKSADTDFIDATKLESIAILLYYDVKLSDIDNKDI